MKGKELTALPARLLTVNSDVTELRIRRNAAYEVNGGFYFSLANHAQSKVEGVKLTISAHGPRLSEIYGIKGDLNTLGLHVKANRDLTTEEKRKIEKAISFYLDNITVKRTIKRYCKHRAELRANTIIHRQTTEESICAILKYIIAF